ncbi:MAG: hypothetical protein JNK82_37370 [Myxococcaceae bacterium]|nr:hypothetical protein [Myxococcaceae bacterium]
MLRRTLRPEALALVFTAVTGAAMAIGVQQSPHGVRPIVDERYYVEWALSIAQGHVIGDAPFWLDPLHAYLLGFVFWLTKGSLLAGRLFNVALGVGTVALVGAIARTLWSRREGALAMWLLALYAPHTFMFGFLMKEALVVHLAAWALLLAVRGPGAAFGLTLGLLWVARGNFVALVPFALAWAAWQLRKTPLRIAALLVCTAAPLAAASAHNLAAGGSWRPMTALAGPNFYYGNNPDANGVFKPLPFVKARTYDEKVEFLAEAERRVGHALTQQEMSDYWLRQGLQFWREHPGQGLWLLAKKVWFVVHDYEAPDTYPQSCFKRWLTPVLWGLPLSFGLLLGLALVGAWSASRRAWPLIAFAALYAGTIVVFFVFDRYRIPLCVPLCVFAAHGLTWLHDRRLPWRAFAVVVAATVVSIAPSPASVEADDRDRFCAFQIAGQLEADGLHDEARLWHERAK